MPSSLLRIKKSSPLIKVQIIALKPLKRESFKWTGPSAGRVLYTVVYSLYNCARSVLQGCFQGEQVHDTELKAAPFYRLLVLELRRMEWPQLHPACHLASDYTALLFRTLEDPKAKNWDESNQNKTLRQLNLFQGNPYKMGGDLFMISWMQQGLFG